jgi:hypothetical protein
MSRFAAARVAGVASILALSFVAASAQPLRATSAAPLPASASSRSEDGVRWRDLTPSQRQALAPLEREWASIDAPRKQKWLALAGRFYSLDPEARARITDRMSEWARLSPVERGQARIRFEEARQVPVPDRKERWRAYQALPADAKQMLAARAASAAASSRADTGRRDATTAKIRNGRDSREAKVNVVPSVTTVQPPRQVTPTLVQAGPGATTTLITRRPAPPAHQRTGMPKIAATPEFINRATLLPRRGPQAPVPARLAAPASAAAPALPSSSPQSP